MSRPIRRPSSSKTRGWGLGTLALACALALCVAPGQTRPHDDEVRPQPTRRYIVQLERPPLVRYDGQVPGLDRPRRDRRGKLVVDDWVSQSYLALLDRDQRAFEAALARVLPSARVHWRYRILYNGLAVAAPRGALRRLARLPGVRSVRTTDRRLIEPVMDVSLPLIGAPTFWDAYGGVGLAGQNVKVAVIDTGIDPDNPFFDPGTLSYPMGYPKGATAYTTPKVIAARAYFRPDDPVDTSRDTPNPVDHLGHGSHCAGTIAGVADTVFDLGPHHQPVVSGVAPRARLMNYKVFYRAESGAQGAHEPELMAAFEDAVADGADVISNSWGGADIFGDQDPSLEAYGAAIDAGCIVVFAAGNDGPGETSVGSPGSYGPFITVGNISTGRHFTRYLEVTAPAPVDPDLTRVSMSVGYNSGPFSSPLGPATLRSSHLVDGGLNENGCATFSATAFENTIALLLRGECSFNDKIQNAIDAGALGAIVYNNEPGEGHYRMSGSDRTVPTVMISYEDGLDLRAWIETHPGAEAILHTGYVPYVTQSDIDRVVYSSSRGPTAQAVLKPDIAAPGSEILSADAHRVGSSSTRIWGWKSGTSMATPHVAGAAALLKRVHPSWTHTEVKAALLGRARRQGVTSWVEGDARPWEVGAGHLALDRLVDVRLLATPAVLSFGEGLAGDELSRTVRLTPVADDIQVVSPLWNADAVLTGMGVEPPHGGTVSLDASGDTEVTFTVTLPSAAEPGEYTGWVELTDDGSGLTVVPYHVRVIPEAPERDLLIVDLQFSAENERPDYAPYYIAAAEHLGLTWHRAPVGDYAAAPSVPQMLRYRAVLVITGDDVWNHFGHVGRGTLDRVSSYMLRGGRVIIAGQGPFRGTWHTRIQGITGTGTVNEYPLYDDTTETLLAQSEYVVRAVDHPALVTGDVDVAPGLGEGELAQVAELLFVTGFEFNYGLDTWTTPVLKMTQGNFAGYGYMGMVYDPFPSYGLDRLAEAHSHRAVVLGFGLELINQVADASTIEPGSREELLQRAFHWVADRVTVSVAVARQDLDVTLDASALSSQSTVDTYWVDFGDGSDPVESTEPVVSHHYDAFGAYDVTLVARSATGAAGLWRRTLHVQPGSEGIDGGVLDAGPTPDGDATIIEGRRGGCGNCRASTAPGGGVPSLPLLVAFFWLLVCRRRRRKP